MKQQIKRLPVYAVIFVLIFLVCQVFFTPGLNETSVRLQMICPANDEYQLFYLNDGIAEFQETASIRQAVVGNQKTQEIKFELTDQRYAQVRIDLGTQIEKRIRVQDILFLQQNLRADYSAQQLKQQIESGIIVLHDLIVQPDTIENTVCFQATIRFYCLPNWICCQFRRNDL